MILPQPSLDTGLIAQIDSLTISFENFVPAFGKAAGDCRSDHALVASDPDFSRTHELIADVLLQSVITASDCLTSPALGHHRRLCAGKYRGRPKRTLKCGRPAEWH